MGLGGSDVRHRRWTAEEYMRLAASGILPPDERLELLDGMIVYREGSSSIRHMQCVAKINRWLIQTLPANLGMFSQGSTRMTPTSVPEPDFAILSRPVDQLDDIPQSEDIVWVIEVSDSTLRTDRETKAALYASAGIREYWIVNLSQRALEVYREPMGDGYRLIRRYTELEKVEAPFEQSVTVADLLPKR